MKEDIVLYIKEWEDYPRMYELVVKFTRTRYDGSPDMGRNTLFLIALLELLSEGRIYYDSKHDAWLYTAMDNLELPKLVSAGTILSGLPAKGEKERSE